MPSFSALRFEFLSSRFGFLYGAALLTLALVGLLALLRWGPSSRAAYGALLAAVVAAAAVGAALFTPAAGRVGKAVWRVAASPGPPAPSGPYPVSELDIALPPREGAGAAIPMRLFVPATGPGTPARTVSCAALGATSLADPAPRATFPLLLYTPGLLSVATDASSTAAQLASRGFVVAALDDPDHDAPRDEAKPFFDFSSDEAFARTVTRSTEKSRVDALRAIEALDRLQACAKGAFAVRVDFARVGAYGVSFGGSVAAAAALHDPRIVAAADLSGWIFGPARERLDKPFLLLLEDEPLPTQKDLESPNTAWRVYERAQADFLASQARRLAAPDAYGFMLRGTAHANFSDSIFTPAGAKYWAFADPQQAQATIVAYLSAFFGHYLRGEPAGPLAAPPGPEILRLNGRPDWRTWK